MPIKLSNSVSRKNYCNRRRRHTEIEIAVSPYNTKRVNNYANVNYSLLGKIIESVSGQSYSDYITENLFEPLQLPHTAATLDGSIENGLISGYTNYWGFHMENEHKYPTSENAWITVPAGYISSSANDLGKYLQMYLNGGNGIISEPSINTMFMVIQFMLTVKFRMGTDMAGLQ